MQKMAEFFDWINSLLGVTSQEELIFHPVFLGFCILAFVYSFFKGWKLFYLVIAGVIGGAVIFSYLYPQDSSDLRGLLTFLGAIGGMVLLLVYLAFVRE